MENRCNLWLFLAMCFCGCLFFSCSSSNDVTEDVPGIVTFENNTQDFWVLEKGGKIVVNFHSNHDGKVAVLINSENNEDWFTIDKHSFGVGDNTIVIDIDNTTNTQRERQLALSLNVGDPLNPNVVSIKQSKCSYLEVKESAYEVNIAGGYYYLPISTNLKYDVIIPEEFQNWLHFNRSSSNGIDVYVSPNTDYNGRTGELYVVGDSLKAKINVFQFGEGYVLSWSKKNVVVSSDGDEVKLYINSNVSYDMIMPNVDWIKKVDNSLTRTIVRTPIQLKIDENTNYESRQASIVICDNNNSLRDTIVITQAQRDSIVVTSEKYFKLSTEEQYISITVNTNMDNYKIKYPDWIKESNESERLRKVFGIKKHTFKINQFVSKSVFDRNGTIVFTRTDNLVSDTVHIVQENEFYLKRQDELIDGERKRFECYTRLNYNIKYSIDNPDVVSIDENGFITAKSIGKAIVTASTEDDQYSGKCEITVKNPTDNIEIEKIGQRINQNGIFIICTIVNKNNVSIQFKKAEQSVGSLYWDDTADSDIPANSKQEILIPYVMRPNYIKFYFEYAGKTFEKTITDPLKGISL